LHDDEFDESAEWQALKNCYFELSNSTVVQGDFPRQMDLDLSYPDIASRIKNCLGLFLTITLIRHSGGKQAQRERSPINHQCFKERLKR
jgi:hypothetical protein